MARQTPTPRRKYQEMEKTILLACILVLALALATPAHSKYYSESERCEPVQLKKTHLKFFIHDILSGKSPSAVEIARPKSAKDKKNPTPFGSVFAIDDLLTEGPEITSRVVGNAQGMYLSSGQGKNLELVMYVDLGFTRGKFNGSSLSVFSRNPVMESRREMAVVGGRGLFRRAEGSVFVKTHFLNYTNGDAVLEYTVEVVHP